VFEEMFALVERLGLGRMALGYMALMLLSDAIVCGILLEE
jgi:hypothetical protein